MEEKQDKTEKEQQTSEIKEDPKLEKKIELNEKPRNKITIEIKKEELDAR